MTLVVASGELLRMRPATNMPGSFALEVVRPCRKPEVWAVVPASEVHERAQAWAAARGVRLEPGD